MKQLLRGDPIHAAGGRHRLSKTAHDAVPRLDAAELLRKISQQSGSAEPVLGVDAKFVKSCIVARGVRGQFFPPHLFADPAWDIFLDLTLARLEGRRVSVSSLAIASNVPTTTALRWIGGLTDAGMLVRRPDPTDSRRSHLSLSDDIYETMSRCLALMRAKMTC